EPAEDLVAVVRRRPFDHVWPEWPWQGHGTRDLPPRAERGRVEECLQYPSRRRLDHNAEIERAPRHKRVRIIQSLVLGPWFFVLGSVLLVRRAPGTKDQEPTPRPQGQEW